jgi:hypothetical protein
VSGDEFGQIAQRVNRIDCPVSWCVGDWYDHGGDDAHPEQWQHMGESIDLGGLGIGAVVATASSDPRFYVSLDFEQEVDEIDMVAVVAQLRTAADAIERAYIDGIAGKG